MFNLAIRAIRSTNRLHLLLVAALLCAFGTMASAQDGKIPDRLSPDMNETDPHASGNGVPPDDGAVKEDMSDVDTLLDALSVSPTTEIASHLEQSVIQTWLKSGSDTIDLLMQRAMLSMEAKDFGVALELLDAVVELKPEFAEGWNKRATLYYLIDDYDRSMRDIMKVLELEPRHFGALSGLGLIFQEVGNDKAALAAFRQALDVHPFLENARKAVETLARDVDGDAI